jgi:predicted metal-dependent enzyme (double-stranded beta helix superfamily)
VKGINDGTNNAAEFSRPGIAQELKTLSLGGCYAVSNQVAWALVDVIQGATKITQYRISSNIRNRLSMIDVNLSDSGAAAIAQGIAKNEKITV